MPYGCLDPQTLSEASRNALERAVDRWQKSMQISRPQTFLVLASYDENPEQELQLIKDFALRALSDLQSFQNNVIEISAKNDEDLALRITRTKELMPIDTLIVFAESRHAISLRPIFKRKFGRVLQVKTFKAEFEINHPWISTSSSPAWVSWNLLVRVWFELRKRMGRGLRKRLRFWFRP